MGGRWYLKLSVLPSIFVHFDSTVALNWLFGVFIEVPCKSWCWKFNTCPSKHFGKNLTGIAIVPRPMGLLSLR